MIFSKRTRPIVNVINGLRKPKKQKKKEKKEKKNNDEEKIELTSMCRNNSTLTL